MGTPTPAVADSQDLRKAPEAALPAAGPSLNKVTDTGLDTCEHVCVFCWNVNSDKFR